MKTIVLIGAGNMGGALLQGWIGSWRQEAAFHVIDPVAEASDRYPGVAFHAEAAALPAGLKPDVVILAVKPDKVVPALKEVAPHIGPATCIVSVAAGVGIDIIRHRATRRHADCTDHAQYRRHGGLRRLRGVRGPRYATSDRSVAR